MHDMRLDVLGAGGRGGRLLSHMARVQSLSIAGPLTCEIFFKANGLVVETLTNVA